MNKLLLKILFTSITIIWMSIIFMFSNQNSKVSTGSSNSFIRRTIIAVYKIFNSNASEEELNIIVDKLDVPIRKIGHLMEYFILGVLVFFTFRAYNINYFYLSLLVCFVYACSDEIHQLFVPGRSGNVIDVLVDTFGSFCAIILLFKVFKK